MPKWGDDSDEVDAFGDVICEPVQVVGGRTTPPEETLAQNKTVLESVKRIFSTVQLTVPHHAVVSERDDPQKLMNRGRGEKLEFVVYVIQCTGLEKSWQVQKRFSEIHAIHTKLLTLNKGRHDKVPSFPSRVKKLMQSENEQVRKRTAKLDKYFGALWERVKKQELLGEDLLIHFLQTDTHAGDFTTISDALVEQEKADRLIRSIHGSWRAGPAGSPHEDLHDEKAGAIKLPDVPWTPAATVVTDGGKHLIVLEVPGLEDGDLTTTALEDGLRVYGHRAIDVPNTAVVHNDRSFGSFAIDFLIPERYLPFTSFHRTLRNGLLTITFDSQHENPYSARSTSPRAGGMYSPRARKPE
eukprot:TRINITY_DN24786_c0_g1_i1.p2 TRINITY_DN24786_c0_g1~~TRINITY_DN24786_c0_g1_i1.p2  ORF type:complete len:355 (+),score=146.56 TRINITY_DN24786_c0_g1_i1:68-1132(+)